MGRKELFQTLPGVVPALQGLRGAADPSAMRQNTEKNAIVTYFRFHGRNQEVGHDRVLPMF